MESPLCTFPPAGYILYGNDLFSDMLSSKAVPLEVAQDECLELIRSYCAEGQCPLAGNSIQCDREIMQDEMPLVYQYLSHRMIDVSTFLGIFERWAPALIDRWRWSRDKTVNYNHRALDDTLSSIETLKWIRSVFFGEAGVGLGSGMLAMKGDNIGELVLGSGGDTGGSLRLCSGAKITQNINFLCTGKVVCGEVGGREAGGGEEGGWRCGGGVRG